jgi:ABC-type branched-subunit amino acid transport system ATPase component
MTDTLLELKQLSLSYGGVHALEDISLRLPSGGITGLIGPNGAGKTSLFNVITGFRGQVGVRSTMPDSASTACRCRRSPGRALHAPSRTCGCFPA